MVHLSERRRLGKSSVYLPPLGIGCAPIGEIYDRISDQQAADTLDAALRKGIRYFDVAPSYGAGLAEMRLGRALRRAADEAGAYRVPRSECFVSTKVTRRLVPDPSKTPNTMDHADAHGWAGGLNGFNSVMDCSYNGFLTQHTESLQRMGLASVDGLLIHGPGSPSSSPEEWSQLTEGGGFRALCELRQRGSVRALGCGFGGPFETVKAVLDACPMDYMCLASVRNTISHLSCLSMTKCASSCAGIHIADPTRSRRWHPQALPGSRVRGCGIRPIQRGDSGWWLTGCGESCQVQLHGC